MTTTKTILSRILFLIYILAVFYLLFAGGESVPTLDKTFCGIPGDKIAHFLLFVPFPILSYMSFDHKAKIWNAVGFVVLTFLAGAAIAALTEYIQKFIPTRVMDITDFYADLTALGACSLVVLVVAVTRKGK